MFKLEPLTEINWPVRIRVPRSGGKVENIDVEIVYPLLEDDELQELLKLKVKEVVLQTVKGWRPGDFGDARGALLDYSAETLDLLCKRTYITRALFDGFVNAQSGALEKN